MLQPSDHESAALAELNDGKTAEATVLALLALASALDRLAAAADYYAH